MAQEFARVTWWGWILRDKPNTKPGLAAKETKEHKGTVLIIFIFAVYVFSYGKFIADGSR